jgi:hypothetical protein
MATIKINNVTALTESSGTVVLNSAVTGGSGLTALGTVTTGDVSAIQDGWVHILSKNQSSANAITINASDNSTVFTSAYQTYLIAMSNYGGLSAAGSLRCRFEYNGSIATASYGYNVQDYMMNQGTAQTSYNSGSYDGIKLSGEDSRSANYLFGGMLMYLNDTHANSRQICQWTLQHHRHTNGVMHISIGGGSLDPSSYPVTGINFYMTNSSTWSATFKVFGLKG